MNLRKVINSRLSGNRRMRIKINEGFTARVATDEDPRIEGQLVQLVEDDLSNVPLFRLLGGELKGKKLWLSLRDLKVAQRTDPITGERLI